jgi:hypothetical protein
MNSRTTVILALLAAVAAVAVWAIVKSGTPEHKVEISAVRVFPDAKPEDVASITLSRSGPLGVVALTQSGGKWELTDPVKAPADPYQAGDLARQLAELSYSRAVALTPASAAEFGLQPPTATVKFTSAKREHELLVGGNVGFGAQQFTYVATPGAKEAYLIKGTLRSLAVDEVANFRAKTMIEAGGDVAGLTLTRSGETISADKTAAGWTLTQPVRTRGDSAALEAVAAAAQGLTAGAFITNDLSDLGKYGLDKPRLTVALLLNTPAPFAPAETSAAKPVAAQLRTVTIQIGGYADLPKTRAYALVLGTPSVITLPEAKVRDLDKDLFTLRDKRVLAADPEQVEKLVLNLAGNDVTVERLDGKWRITAPEVAPAEADEVSSVLTRLGDIKVKEFKDHADLKDAAYGLEPPYGTIAYRVHGQTAEQTVTIGKNAKNGELWACEAGTATVGRVDGGAVVDCKRTWLDLRSRTIFKLAPGQVISRISWTHSGETVTIARLSGTGSETPWAMTEPVKAELDGDKVAKLVEALSNLNAKKWVAKADKAADYGLDKPQITLSVTVSGVTAETTATTLNGKFVDIDSSVNVWQLTMAEKNGKLVAMKPGIPSLRLGYLSPEPLIFELDRSILDLLGKPMWKGPWLEFDKDRVTHLEIAGPQLAITFIRAGQEWSSNLPDLQANSMRVNWYLGDLAGLEVARVIRYAAKDFSEFGLDKPAWRIRLKGLAVDKTLLVSDKGPGADRYATIEGSGVVVVLDATQIARIVKDQSYFRGGDAAQPSPMTE